MTRVLPVVVALILAIYALIDCLQTDAGRLKSLNKPAWLAIIVFLPVIGPILWLVAAKRGSAPRPARPQPKPQLPPDDNPEFLRELRNLDDEHEKLLNEWEDSLRRREEEHRKQNPSKDSPTSDPSDEKPSPREDGSAEEELRKRGDGGDDDPR